MSEERVFSEQEVGQIIRRAVELTEEGTVLDYKPGVSQSELEKIAAEVGVAPEALNRAILETGQRTGKKGPFNLTEEFERVIEGELDPDQFDVLTEGVKPLSNVGQPSFAQVGRSMTMSAWTGIGQAKVDVTSRNGRTKLKVKSNAIFQMLMSLYPGFIGSIVTMAALSERGLGWLGAAISVLVMTIAGFVFSTLTKAGHRKAEKLADSLRDRIAATISSQTESKQPQKVEEQEALEQRLGQG